jgi:hypothetical protein
MLTSTGPLHKKIQAYWKATAPVIREEEICCIYVQYSGEENEVLFDTVELVVEEKVRPNKTNEGVEHDKYGNRVEGPPVLIDVQESLEDLDAVQITVPNVPLAQGVELESTGRIPNNQTAIVPLLDLAQWLVLQTINHLFPKWSETEGGTGSCRIYLDRLEIEHVQYEVQNNELHTHFYSLFVTDENADWLDMNRFYRGKLVVQQE